MGKFDRQVTADAETLAKLKFDRFWCCDSMCINGDVACRDVNQGLVVCLIGEGVNLYLSL